MNQMFAFASVEDWVKATQEKDKKKKEKLPYPIADTSNRVPVNQVNKFKPLLPQKPNISADFTKGPTTLDVKQAKEIIKKAAKLYSVPLKDIYNKNVRYSWVVRARQYAFYEAYCQIKRMTYSELARTTGFHHATIMHAVLREAEHREGQRLLKERMENEPNQV